MERLGNPAPIVRQAETLAALEAKAKQQQAAILGLERDTEEARKELGKTLLAAQKYVPRGQEWVDWVQEVVGIPISTGYRYMEMARPSFPDPELEKQQASAPPGLCQTCQGKGIAGGCAECACVPVEPDAPPDDDDDGDDEEEEDMQHSGEGPMCLKCERAVRNGGKRLEGCPFCRAMLDARQGKATSVPAPHEPEKYGPRIRDMLAKIRGMFGDMDHGDPSYTLCMNALGVLEERCREWPALEMPAKPGVFVKPTLAEVTAYCNERAAGGRPRIDPEAFINHYESKRNLKTGAWMIGNRPMSDWKAAVHTWENNEKNRERTGGNGTGKNSVGPNSRVGLAPGTLERINAKVIRGSETPFEQKEAGNSPDSGG